MKKMEHNFYKKFFSEPLFKKSSRTCILDLITQLEKQVVNFGSVILYFYSDMLEDSHYRVMSSSLANSRNTAELMADEDLKKLEKKYGKSKGDFLDKGWGMLEGQIHVYNFRCGENFLEIYTAKIVYAEV